MTNNYPLLLTCIFTLFCLPFLAHTQENISGVVNSYTPVVAIEQCEAIVTVADASEFSAGDAVLLIQMKGARINESNTDVFGTPDDIGSAGLYERNEISTINGNELTLRYSVLNSYDFGGAVQLVRIPVYEGATVTGALTALPWDGSIGGVLVIDAGSELNVTADITVSGLGFRGGQSNTALIDSCSSVTFGGIASGFVYPLNDWRGAQKGEGIADYINEKEAGRARQFNGGGGANDHNTGGGGGGHHTPGGQGGSLESIDACRGEFPGLGGLPIQNDSTRLFMGGGGGGGHAADGNGSDGGNGGGIVIIFADLMLGGGTIAANGIAATEAQEGAGGGGAAGSIVLMIEEIRGLVLLEANGGNGGDTDAQNTPNCYGPGGGGSAGRIYTASANTSAPGLSGGVAGLVTNSTATCNGTSNGAMESFRGQVRLLTEFPQNLVESPAIDSVQIADCGVFTGSSVTFAIDYPGADFFEYSIAFNNGDFSPQASTDTDSLSFTNLGSEDSLTLLIRAIGSNGCESAFDTVSCTTTICATVGLVAETNIDTLYCLEDEAFTLTATPSGGDFVLEDGANITSLSPMDLGVGRFNVNYIYVDSLGCQRDDFYPVRVADIPDVPVPSCSEITDSTITFTWNETADQYRVSSNFNGIPLVPNIITGTSIQFDNLSFGDSIRIDLVALGVGPCGESVSISQTCIVQDCPPQMAQIDSLLNSTFCIDDVNGVQLTASPDGGEFTGEGVTTDGFFDPTQIQIPEDSTSITLPVAYTLPDDGSCPMITDTILLTVLTTPAAAEVLCDSMGLNAVRFNWTHGTTDSFNVAYSINGEAPISIDGTVDTLLLVDNLGLGDSVELLITPLISGNCGIVESTSQTCFTDDCGDTTSEIIGLASVYCREDDPVQLTATPLGGTFAGNSVTITGEFDPQGANLGSNVITYEFIDVNGCAFRDTVATEVSNETPVPIVNCESGGNQVTFMWTHPSVDTFSYSYSINFGDPIGPFGTRDASVTITGLMAGDIVLFSIQAIDVNGCGDSELEPADCEVGECVDNPPIIENLASTYCQDQDEVVLMGEPAGGTFFLDGDVIMTLDPSTLDIGIYEIEYVFIELGGCRQDITQTVEITDVLPPPIIECGNPTAQSLEFTWANDSGINYGFNVIVGEDTIQSGETNIGLVAVGGLLPDSAARIELFPLEASDCFEAQTTQVCRTLACTEEMEATLDLAAEYCLSDREIPLNATPNTGVFSGDGVDPEGFFNPALAGSGELEIIYAFVDDLGCPFIDTFSTNIILSVTPPTISCGNANSSSATFTWSHPNENAEFTYTISLDGEDYSPEITSTDTSYTQNNLDANSDVFIRIFTVGPEECGNSDTITVMCATNNCVPFELEIEPVESVCLEGNEINTIQLTSNLPDSLSFSTIEWSGNGIVDAATGLFDPNDPALTLGGNLIQLEAIDSEGCTYFASTAINLSQQPAIEILDAPEINCQDSLIVLTTNMMNTNDETAYQWTTQDGNIVSGRQESNAVVNLAGTYIITARNGGCVATDSLLILENRTLPTADAGENQAIPCDDAATITLGGDNTSEGDNFIYYWAGPALFTSNEQEIEVTDVGIYTLVVEDTTNFCRSEVSTVEVIDSSASIAINVDVSGLLTCITDEVTLNASDSEGTGTLNFEWSDAAGVVSPFSENATITVTQIGTYTVRARDEDGCESVSDIVVGEDRVLPTVNAGSDQNIGCVIEEALLGSDENPIGSNFIFEWSGGELDDSSPLRPTVRTDGIYVLSIENIQNGCEASDTVFVTANDALITDLGATVETPFCFGDENGSIAIDSTIGGTSPYLYALDDGRFSALNRFTNLSPADYQISVRDAAGCTFETTITVEGPAELQATLSAETEVRLGDSIIIDLLINSNTDSIVSIFWNIDDKDSCEGCLEFGIRPTEKTTIRVEVEDVNGCVTSDQLTIFVENESEVFRPNAFSPNGDSRNDFFFLQVGTNVERIENLRIYDRWGTMVFQQPEVPINDPTAGWDGTFEGTLLNPAVFIYSATVVYKDGRTENLLGDVALIR